MTQSTAIGFNLSQPVEFTANDMLPTPSDAAVEHGANNPDTVPLSALQHQALEWLMTGGSLTEAAELVGVKRQTVSRWANHHVEFSRLYHQWQEQVRTGAEARLVGLTDAAIDNLIAAVRDSRDVKASQFVLKLLGIAARPRG